MSPQQTLAQRVRAKYPGAYDDIPDQELEASVRAKFPGVYDDIPTTTAKAPAAAPSGPQHPYARLTQSLGDVLIGALKGGGETAINLGQMLHTIPGVSSIVDKLYGEEGLSERSFPAARAEMAPTNTAQRIGKGAEQMAEVVGAGGVVRGATRGVTRVLPRMAIEGAAGAGMSAAQGGDPVTGGVLSAALVAPVPAAISRTTSGLRNQATQHVNRALGPTKERFKAMTEKIAPDVIKRGISGSREQIKAQADDMLGAVGQQIDDAIAQFGSRSMSTQPIVEALEQSKAPFLIKVANEGAEGATKAVTLDPRAVGQLTSLQKVVRDIGDTATAEQLVAVRRAWDKIVSQAGGYQQHAAGGIGVGLRDQSEAFAKREGATAIRRLLDAEVPELSAINKEFAFWKTLDDVVTQTLKRTTPQQPGLAQQAAKGIGAMAGGMGGSAVGPAGTVGGVIVGAQLAKALQNALSSSRWHLVNAQLKDKLATAIASGDKGKVADAIMRISSVQASKAGQR